jgi:hypothetical protein
MTVSTEKWAILRHLTVATRDALADGAAASASLQLPPGFADPALTDVGLTDYVTPIGPQKFFEVVGPIDAGSSINRWLDRVGGQGGYCLAVQVPDLAGCKARALELGVRMVVDQTYLDYPLIQMHPRDVGILLELDGIPDQNAWYWDGITPPPAEAALVDDVLSVRIGTPDPSALTATWAQIVGLTPTSDTSLDFSGCRMEFEPSETSQILGAELQLAPRGADRAPEQLLGLDVTYRATVDA